MTGPGAARDHRSPLHPEHLPRPCQEPPGPESQRQLAGGRPSRARRAREAHREAQPQLRPHQRWILQCWLQELGVLPGGGPSEIAPLPRKAPPTAERATQAYGGHRRLGSRERAGRGPLVAGCRSLGGGGTAEGLPSNPRPLLPGGQLADAPAGSPQRSMSPASRCGGILKGVEREA